MEEQNRIYDENYPEKDFKKTIYDFTPAELRNLSTFVGLVQIGKIAENLANNFVSNEVVKRIGVKTTADSGILYDVAEGKVTVYIPKQICSKCGVRRAEVSYKSKIYCKACSDIEVEGDKKPVEKVEVKKKK